MLTKAERDEAKRIVAGWYASIENPALPPAFFHGADVRKVQEALADLDAKDEEIARLQKAFRAAQSPKTEVWVVWYFFCAIYGGDASVEGVFTTREAAKAYVDKDDSLIDSYRVERFEVQDGEVETGG